jgi:hypothetical protein
MQTPEIKFVSSGFSNKVGCDAGPWQKEGIRTEILKGKHHVGDLGKVRSLTLK